MRMLTSSGTTSAAASWRKNMPAAAATIADRAPRMMITSCPQLLASASGIGGSSVQFVYHKRPYAIRRRLLRPADSLPSDRRVRLRQPHPCHRHVPSDQMKGPSPNRDAGDNAVVPTRMLRAVRGGQPMEPNYIGVDLHKAFFQACALTATGARLWEARFPRTEGGVAVFGARSCTATPIAVEATGPTWSFVDALQPTGATVCVIDPRKTKLKAGYAAKTDRLDARRLADALRRESVVSIYIPPPAIRQLREVCRGRHQLVRLRTRLAQMIRALLLRCDAGEPPGTRLYAPRAQAWLAAVHLPPDAERSLRRLERLYREVH